MRILIVEDQEETARMVKEKLEAERYAVDVEHDGERGLYRARTNDYDLILLDNVLPGKTGPEICRALREYKATMPILILSAQSEIERKVGLLDGGADDYLTKPFSLRELSARVHALLRRPRDTMEDVELTIHDLSLNRTTYSAIRGTRPITLAPKEFSLLEYLMKNSGTVVSRQMILEHVWDKDGDPFSNTIEAHIANLRRKIDRNAKVKLIQTIPGRGYMIK
jgi:DNA-binding response OmpR family regulator